MKKLVNDASRLSDLDGWRFWLVVPCRPVANARRWLAWDRQQMRRQRRRRTRWPDGTRRSWRWLWCDYLERVRCERELERRLR
jgi:hypothetical protein